MSESRIARMLTTIKPSGSDPVEQNTSDVALVRDNAVVLGYDDVVPSSMEWIRQAVKSYPSQDSVGDLTAILGNQKAIERHATSVANGNIESVEALGRAVAKRLEDSTSASRLETYTAYGIDNDGERVKLTLGVNDKKQGAKSYELRRDMGASYMPESVRRFEQSSAHSSVDASLAIAKRDNAMGLSGAQDFVPVIAVPTASYTSTKNNAPSSLRNRQMHSSRQVLSNWQKCNNMQAQCRRQMRNNRRLHSKWQVRNNRQMRRNPSKPMSAKS